jgi:N,N'-diacetyllegionaminate synthase
MTAAFRVADRIVGPGAPCFVVAEAGVNHDGDPERALRLVGAAAEAGADAVKFQTFDADLLASPRAAKAQYQARATGGGEMQADMLRRLQLSEEVHHLLADEARRRGLLFLSTPFDVGSADFLVSLGVPALKMGSGELTNLPLLAHVAGMGRPLMLSTGMADLAEVDAAVAAVRAAGSPPLALLHCVSCYPADPADVNLRAMETMSARYGVPVGFSDHTLGIEIALAAVALGASILEKHLTLDRSLPGPDHAASIEPGEMAALVRGVRLVEAALGHGRKEPAPGERELARAARRSLVAARDIPEGAVLTSDLVTILRPGTGLPAASLPALLGRRVRRAIPAGTLLSMEMLA